MRLEVGAACPAVERAFSLESLRRYAKVAGDHNPIHLDADYAESTPFGGIVVHGMLVLACLNEALEVTFGPSWRASGALNVRFKTPVRPGEIVRATCSISGIEPQPDSRILVRCSVLCTISGPDPAIIGEASVLLPREIAAVDGDDRPDHVV